MNNKKLIVLATATIFATGVCLARPAPGGRPAPKPAPRHQVARPAPPPKPAPRPHHGGKHRRDDGFWGRGGGNFWPGFIGGLVGAIVGG